MKLFLHKAYWLVLLSIFGLISGCDNNGTPFTQPGTRQKISHASGGRDLSNSASMLFSEYFDNDLSRWVGRWGDPNRHHAMLVEDPLRPGNKVVSFSGFNSGGDIYSPEIPVEQGQKYLLSFEYLSFPKNEGLPGELGGFIGFSEDTPLRNRWLASSKFCCGSEDDMLINDGKWHKYTIEFDVFECCLPGQNTSFEIDPPLNNTIRLMLEDYSQEGDGAVANHVFFDNIQLKLKISRDVNVDTNADPGKTLNAVNAGNPGNTISAIRINAFDAVNADQTIVRFSKYALSIPGMVRSE